MNPRAFLRRLITINLDAVQGELSGPDAYFRPRLPLLALIATAMLAMIYGVFGRRQKTE
jgi:hypothetical protein